MAEDILREVFKTYAGNYPVSVKGLQQSGSDRQYFRLSNGDETIVGVYNEDVKENLAFLSFTRSFLEIDLPVPEILFEHTDKKHYLLQDLGDEMLFDIILQADRNTYPSEKIISYYKDSLGKLAVLQTKGAKVIDFSVCYPRRAFDKQSMRWDLNYFKYYFLKLAGVLFDEQKLENDFKTLTKFLLKARSDFFMFRDFQSRNIMVKESEIYFIDYQGGRKGAPAYDVASLLYDPKADIPQKVKEQLLQHYMLELMAHTDVTQKEFMKHYYGFVLIRLMQALGAFGFRGFYERKPHFLDSIPFALKELDYLVNNISLPVEIPELWRCFKMLATNEKLMKISES